MTRHSFKKNCLLTFLIVGIAFIQGCTPNMSHGTQHKTMREELLGFAQGNHPREERPDEKVTQIVKKYIQLGMPMAKAIEIAHEDGIEIKKVHRTQFEINKNVDFYVGSINHIPMPLSPLNYKEVRIILETEHNQALISDIRVHLFVFGL
jgi:hypothetical protein